MAKGSVNVPGVPAKDLLAHTSNKENPHGVTKKQIGLENVDNTADKDKPVSTLQQAAIDDAKKAGTDAQANLETHAGSTTAHNDIRELVATLKTRLNALADSDDTTLDQLSEIVAYIKSNKTLIESVTTNKISVDKIVDDLLTADASKVLSANQGVVLKGLIDSLSSEIANKESSGTAASLINRTTAVNAADTNYTTLMARGTSLNSAETTPAVNGAIAWTYE